MDGQLLFGILVVITLVSVALGRKQQRLPPGPKGLPIIGNILDVPSQAAWKQYAAWATEYGAPFLYIINSLRLGGLI